VDSAPVETSIRFTEPETSRIGRLLGGPGKSNYVDANFWRSLDDDELFDAEGDEEDAEEVKDEWDASEHGRIQSPSEQSRADDSTLDPFSAAFIGSTSQNLEVFHPSRMHAMTMFKIHTENVEPLCKVLHIPTTTQMMERVSVSPTLATKDEECLVFAIYHFAVYSLSDEDCLQQFGIARPTLLQRYRFATRQALVNASFLKTAALIVLQALTLFLMPTKHFYDAHTYWILTGTLVRIAQRIGLHRDGAKLGLDPFDVQMRRRLFFQVMPLDGAACQMAGTGITLKFDSWDTLQPANIDDIQIWPGMTLEPIEQTGRATEMIFCRARICVMSVIVKASWMNDRLAPQSKINDPTQSPAADEKQATPGPPPGMSPAQLESMIAVAESDVESQYLRHLSFNDPLHLLTLGTARSAITSFRIRAILNKRQKDAQGSMISGWTEGDKRDMWVMCLKILDTDRAAFEHEGLLKRFGWFIKGFWIVGLWDSLIYLLTILPSLDICRVTSPVHSGHDVLYQNKNDAWQKITNVYENHDELMLARKPLQIALGRLVLRTWEKNPPSDTVEPRYIIKLRDRRKKGKTATSSMTTDGEVGASVTTNSNTNLSIKSDFSPDVNGQNTLWAQFSTNDSLELFNGELNTTGSDMNFTNGSDDALDGADWSFWDQMIRDHQASAG